MAHQIVGLSSSVLSDLLLSHLQFYADPFNSFLEDNLVNENQICVTELILNPTDESLSV